MTPRARALLFATLSSAAPLIAAACNPPPPPKANDVTQVTVLSRPSENTDWDAAATQPTPTASASAATPPDAGGTEPAAPSASVADLATKPPGTYVVDAYVVRATQCQPCPPRAQCKPCFTAVWISAQKPSGSGDPPDTVQVQSGSDTSSYTPGSHFRFVITLTQSANVSTRKLFSATPL